MRIQVNGFWSRWIDENSGLDVLVRGGGVRSDAQLPGGDPPESHFLMIFSILEIGTCEDPGERVPEYFMPVSSDLGIVDFWRQVFSTRFEASRASADFILRARRDAALSLTRGVFEFLPEDRILR